MAKNQAKAGLVAALRTLSQRIQANPAVSAELKTELGLPLHDRDPSPIPAPATKPVLTVLGIDHLRLADETSPDSRTKPTGVDGAEIWCYVGENPPSELSGWSMYGLTTRTRVEVRHRPEDRGKTVHLVARWFNPRKQVGPQSAPVSGIAAQEQAGVQSFRADDAFAARG